MAKKKYICTGCNKCTEPCTVELSGDADMTKDPTKLMHCGTWVEVPADEDTNKEQRPKLTAAAFSLDDCPEWAQYAAVDADGSAYWYAAKPELGSLAWSNISKHFVARRITLADVQVRYDKADWKNSLIARFTKLTAEIFNHPECPADAVVAVVNARGTAAWGKCADIVCDGISAFKAVGCCGYGTWTPIPGGACFDATDWQHSAVYRAGAEPKSTEPEAPKLTHDVFSYSTLNEWTYVIRSQVEHGKTYARCPAWARYAAVDQSGAVCVYDTKPVLRSTDWYPDSGGRCAVVCNADKWALRFDTTDWKNSLIERPAAAPKLTVDVFALPQCPGWAKYAAVDEDGVAWYYGHKPRIGDGRWDTPGHQEVHAIYDSCKYARFDATDWEHSLIERPSVVPKLTIDVFSMKECPGWARYAAVDANGFGYWYEEKPSLRATRSWLSDNLRYEKMNHPGSNVSIVFDTTDWAHSLIERPWSEGLPKLTVEVFSLPECPSWARYAAVDADGSAYYYRAKPTCGNRGYQTLNTVQRIHDTQFDATDWEHSLIEHPAAAPKLTADVFSMEECPKWARFTAVDADGIAYWYEVPPRLCTASQRWESNGLHAKRLCHPGSSMSILFDADGWKNSLIERQPAEPRQKLTTEVFSMPECPEWARYAAVDASGLAYWYDDVPRWSTNGLRWQSTGTRAMKICYAGAVAVPLFDATDWQHSSIERPLPKLTVDVFSLPDCPIWARYAAVDADGDAYWYDKEPPLRAATWSSIGANHVKQITRDNTKLRYDSSDWEHSLIERPTVVPDWFKPGVLAYNNDTRTCFHVTDSTGYCENYLEAKVRPFSADELARKLGQFVLGPTNSRLLVTGYCPEGLVSGLPVICVLGDRWITAEELLTYGSRPQGIEQYRSKEGTWIDCGLSS